MLRLVLDLGYNWLCLLWYDLGGAVGASGMAGSDPLLFSVALSGIILPSFL